MPDQEIADFIDGLLARMHVGADQRALLYRDLLERQLTQRAKQSSDAVSARTGSESQPLEGRDFLRRVVSQAWNPTQGAPATEPPARIKTRATTTARVVLHDLDSTITGIQSQITRILERHLNALGKGSRWDGHLAKLGVQFKVSFTTKEPSAAAKGAMLPLDYPLYFIDEKQDTFANTIARIHRIMDDHRIPSIIPGTKTKIRERVRKDWGGGLRGVTVAPGIAAVTPFRKCVFFKAKTVAGEANGNAIFYVNCVLHELGHAHNITAEGSHPHDGSVMNSRLGAAAMSIEPLTYNNGHLKDIMVQLGRLWGVQPSP